MPETKNDTARCLTSIRNPTRCRFAYAVPFMYGNHKNGRQIGNESKTLPLYRLFLVSTIPYSYWRQRLEGATASQIMQTKIS